jgi:hypothetical protein
MVEKLREKLSGRRALPHLRHRLRARRQARAVLRRRGLVFLSLRRLASTEEAAATVACCLHGLGVCVFRAQEFFHSLEADEVV